MAMVLLCERDSSEHQIKYNMDAHGTTPLKKVVFKLFSKSPFQPVLSHCSQDKMLNCIGIMACKRACVHLSHFLGHIREDIFFEGKKGSQEFS